MKLGVAVCGLLLLAGAAQAEQRTVEALGVNGFTPPQNLTLQRQRAVSEGVRAAVYQVVAESLPGMEAGEAGSAAQRVVGRKARDFVTSFQVLEDRGVQEKRYSSNRNATHEYVVLVEASVDARLVRNRLVKAGLLSSGAASLRRVDLTLEGLPSYRALEAVQAVLTERLQAASAVPVEFSSHRAVLAVRIQGDGRSLLDQLTRVGVQGFQIEARSADSDRAVAAIRAR